ncbi:MAG: site-2 protease family protein [Clostridia bacterium]|nr:site-2 protease family protein [Oscillospiraceae bacterium]MBQ7032181.1 site-2 protease family protein [Clostridia bacterium]
MLFGSYDLRTMLLRLPIVFLAITVHECAHGYVAYLLGDRTAKMYGRLTLNPLHHMDIMGVLCMVLFGFGWAKPVPVNPQYFKNPKGGMSLVGLAGPLSNFLMAAIFSVLYGLLARFFPTSESFVVEFFSNLLAVGIMLNIGLGIFNLIPIPPLDGSKILAYFLPNRWYYKLMEYERYAMPVLILLLFLGILDRPLTFLQTHVFAVFWKLILLVAGI